MCIAPLQPIAPGRHGPRPAVTIKRRHYANRGPGDLGKWRDGNERGDVHRPGALGNTLELAGALRCFNVPAVLDGVNMIIGANDE